MGHYVIEFEDELLVVIDALVNILEVCAAFRLYERHLRRDCDMVDLSVGRVCRKEVVAGDVLPMRARVVREVYLVDSSPAREAPSDYVVGGVEGLIPECPPGDVYQALGIDHMIELLAALVRVVRVGRALYVEACVRDAVSVDADDGVSGYVRAKHGEEVSTSQRWLVLGWCVRCHQLAFFSLDHHAGGDHSSAERCTA